jgi:hypothetical protein
MVTVMRKTIITGTLILTLAAAGAIFNVKAEKMHEIKVDIGRNILETARNSGAPKFGIESHWGLQIFELVDLRPEVLVQFSRPGYQITATPLFSLTMYADSENNNDMAVEKIELQYRHKVGSHRDAQAFITEILAQFRRGKWKRQIRETCPAITGRSVYLDENGKIGGTCSLDPDYQPPMEDWLILMRTGKDYRWLGDGIAARLTVNYDADAPGLTYNISLEFKDFAIDAKRIAAEQARELAEGDEKGWNSTADFNNRIAENKIKAKLLEVNAVRRGDNIVPRN